MDVLPPSSYFPPAETADADGLVLIGGKLSPEWLVDAYCHGIFPWPIVPDPSLITWFSPDPRAVFELDRFHVSRRLARTIRSGQFRLTVDQAFPEVVRLCATIDGRAEANWITPALQRAYLELHRLGQAHSVEAWHQGQLAGGVYGVAIGGLFAAESMFHRVRDASKVALFHLVERLRERGYQLFDIQQLTPHTARLGAEEIPRREYLKRLARALEVETSFC